MARDLAWLTLKTVRAWEPVAAALGVSTVARSARGFVTAFEAAGGRPERLSDAWRRRRNNFVARHQALAYGEPWWTGEGMPTRRHLALIMWAYSPTPGRLGRTRVAT